MKNVDLLIIGGGPAGLAAAKAAHEAGITNILIVERDAQLGGILRQCIHNGFGLHTFKEELTGTEYAQRYIDLVGQLNVPYICNAMVIGLSSDKIATLVSREHGVEQIKASAVILAMGCRERPLGAIGTAGTRPSGVFTAGTAQKMVNLHGMLPGKRIVILGSGDIGLIMARRMTFTGAEVLACVELMPYSSGLKRNIVQCLNDYDIPLLYRHTVIEIHGRERLSGVTIAQVDKHNTPILGTEKFLECDTLLLSVGLIPENELSLMAGVTLAAATNGAEVDDNLQTSVPGIFSCGNVLHVHDIVDFVSIEAERAGANAAAYVRGDAPAAQSRIPIIDGLGVSGVVPQYLSHSAKDKLSLMFRPRNVYRDAMVHVEADGASVFTKRARILAPGEMVNITVPQKALAVLLTAGQITIRIEGSVRDGD